MHATVVCGQTECLLQVKIPESSRSAFPLKVAGETHTATLSDGGDRQPIGTTCYLEYKKKIGARGRAKANGWLDLELPVGEKCSW